MFGTPSLSASLGTAESSQTNGPVTFGSVNFGAGGSVPGNDDTATAETSSGSSLLIWLILGVGAFLVYHHLKK